jgi:hypothetical protein
MNVDTALPFKLMPGQIRSRGHFAFLGQFGTEAVKNDYSVGN